jgi:hypothetical protein
MRACWRLPQPALVLALVALAIVLVSTPQGLPSPLGGGEIDHTSPPACRSTAILVHGICLDAESSGPVVGVFSASEACAVSGGFLPTPKQLIAARGVLDLGNGRGSHSQFTDSYFLPHHHRVPMTVVVNSVGSRLVPTAAPHSQNPVGDYEYTCSYPPLR